MYGPCQEGYCVSQGYATGMGPERRQREVGRLQCQVIIEI